MPPPTEQREAADRYLQAMRDAQSALEKAVDAYEDRDQEAVDAALERNQARFADGQKIARELGMQECGTN